MTVRRVHPIAQDLCECAKYLPALTRSRLKVVDNEYSGNSNINGPLIERKRYDNLIWYLDDVTSATPDIYNTVLPDLFHSSWSRTRDAGSTWSTTSSVNSSRLVAAKL